MEDKEARVFILEIFEGYKKRKKNNELYNIDSQIPINIIKAYYYYIEKPNFNNVVDNYRKKYVYNESRVEKNISKEEQYGLCKIYDYIHNFNFEKDNFNIFTTSLIIHQKLYSGCLDSSFGGNLRDGSAILYNASVEVPDPNTAKNIHQSYIMKSNNIMSKLDKTDILNYINECVRITTELIKAQPFEDGNKRTFRSLLNLMFKRRNIPPVYIKISEKDEYKKVLLRALIDGNYDSLYHFYYYKICDSIYELDIIPRLINKVEDEKTKNK